MLENGSDPLVSIVILSYNQVDFLTDAVASCLNQDYSNIELIISDNCSTDGSREKIEEFEKKIPHLSAIFAAQNTGVTGNHNAAAKACSGKYVAWMYADDLMLPGKITKQVRHMEANPNCRICYHNLEVFDSDSNEVLFHFNQHEKHVGTVDKLLLNGTFNGACSNMIRRDNAPSDGFNKILPVASDWLYWIEILETGGTIEYIDELLGRYRRHPQNVTAYSAKITQGEIDHLVTCQICLEKFPQHTKIILKRYNSLLYQMRFKLDYASVMRSNLLSNFRINDLAKLVIYRLFGKKY